MLSISLPMRGGGSGDYYIKLAQHEYYTKSLGAPGEWFGTGAEALGLRGNVEGEILKNLLEGKSSDGSKSLVQIQKWQQRERQSGWDLTFSAPKSVSVLWSQSSPEVRAKIEAAHQAAVKKALAFLEKEAGITRRGQGGHVRERAKVVFALFQHGTSRANDPQLHTHAVMVNLSIRADGTTGALASKRFFECKTAAGAGYQIGIAGELREKMNLPVVLEKGGARIEGVSEFLCWEFSSRRRDILAALDKEVDKSAKNAKRMAIKTRPRKRELPSDQLFAQWQETGHAYGWGPEQAKKLVEAATREREGHPSKTELVEDRMQFLFEKFREEQQKARSKRGPTSKNVKPSWEKSTMNDSAEGAAAEREEQPLKEELAKERLPFGFAQDHGKQEKARKWKKPGPIKRGKTAKRDEPSGQANATRNDFAEAAKTAQAKPYFRFERRWLFPRAPEFSPFKNVRVPIPVLGQNKTKAWWGKVRFSVNTPLGELQLRDKKLFPKAPEWSPFKNWRTPRFVLAQNTEWKWRKVIWKKNTAIGQLQFRHKALFPKAVEGSLAYKLSIPAFRLQTKRPELHDEDIKRQTNAH